MQATVLRVGNDWTGRGRGRLGAGCGEGGRCAGAAWVPLMRLSTKRAAVVSTLTPFTCPGPRRTFRLSGAKAAAAPGS